MIDWAKHQFDPVACIHTPRATYMGRELKPGLAETAGMQFDLVAAWMMEDDDPYPGEYALTTEDPKHVFDALGILWIASGDVTPKDTK